MTDSAWGTVPATDVQRLIAQADGAAREIEQLKATIARTRFVADHWRVSILAGDVTGTMAWGAHPLCMVLAAIDGETDPTQCGISPDAHDDFRRIA